MKVVLIRHGKVNFKWRLWYTSEQFNEACRQYNMAPIQQIEYSIPEMVIMYWRGLRKKHFNSSIAHQVLYCVTVNSFPCFFPYQHS